MRPYFGFLLLLSPALSAPESVQPARSAVLVELFTSEGCSSCPPADVLLARLDQLQPVAGVTVIPLEEHVDYWDRLGWRDPFSSAEVTARQQHYAELLRVEGPYTPQMVIDGRREFVGNDSQQALSELANAAHNAKTPVSVTVKEKSSDRISLAVHVNASASAGDILLAITETRLASDVARGENAGHNLKHSAVVRRLSAIGKLKPGDAFSADPVVKLAKDWKPENLRAVVFIQERASGRIVGAAEVSLGR
jgi:hypothetical protein